MKTEPGSTVVYAGGRRLPLPSAEGLVVLDDWQVPPHDLGDALDEACQLVVLDPLSFPFEALPDSLWDLPMAVALPPDLEDEGLDALLGGPVLSRLGLHDVVLGSAGWDRLADTYLLPRSQWLGFGWEQAVEAVEYLVEDAALALEVLANVAGRHRNPSSYWALRARPAKSAFRVQAQVVTAELSRVAAALPGGVQPGALVVGCGVGSWPQLLARRGWEMVGLDLNRGMVEQARLNFPGLSFRHLGSQLGLAGSPESVDVALIAATLGLLKPEGRVRVLRQAWAMLRPGGALLVLDGFVGEKGQVGWLRVGELMAAVAEAAAYFAVLEDVRALRFEGEGIHRAGLVSFTKLGAAVRL